MAVAVVGGGIAGLTAAFFLRRSGIPVQLFEASSSTGGLIGSKRNSGFLVETGPNALQRSSVELEILLEELDLLPDLIDASPAARNRYIVREGTPQALPRSLATFFTSKAISWPARLALAREPFQGPALTSDTSVANFIRQRLGEEWLRYAVDPFVTGIFAGDPEKLSLQNAFPRLFDLQARNGSILRGAFGPKPKRPKVPRRRTFSFREGLGQLPAALTAALQESPQNQVHLNAHISALKQHPEGWSIAVKGQAASHTASHVICTTPLHALPELPGGVPLTPLREVYYPPVSVVALGFRQQDVAHPLDGFGLLIPGKEVGFSSLGVIFSSTLFPNRAPEGHVLLTVLVGGSRQPDRAQRPTEALVSDVLTDLERLLGVSGAPHFSFVQPWPKAIPQYTLGYEEVKQALDGLEASLPGLHFAGNYRQGIAVVDAIASGAAAAARVRQALAL